MDKIIFKAVYKGKRSEFSIDPVGGTGGMWFLFIDNRYHGAFSIYQGSWVFRAQKDDYFTPEQLEKLVEVISKHHPVV